MPDLMERLRAEYDDVPEPDGERLAALRGRLVVDMRAGPSARWRPAARTGRRAGIAAVALAGAGAVAFATLGGGDGERLGIVQRAEAALGTDGTMLHYVVDGGDRHEVWSEVGGLRAHSSGPVPWDPACTDQYNRPTGARTGETICVDAGETRAWTAGTFSYSEDPVDLPALLRQALAAGRLQEAGTLERGGRTLVRLEGSLSAGGEPGHVLVDAESGLPVEIDEPELGAVLRYPEFEVLPLDEDAITPPANLEVEPPLAP